jgi:TRAP-type C4-dicarboxylate transport system substrate-binding protein
MPIRSIALAAALLAGAAVPAQAQTVLKLGHVLAKGSHYDVGASAFCDHVDQGTAGRYKCQVFASSALGGEREQVEAVQLGTQDFVITSTGPVGNFVPEIKIVDVPFLFREMSTRARRWTARSASRCSPSSPATAWWRWPGAKTASAT